VLAVHGSGDWSSRHRHTLQVGINKRAHGRLAASSAASHAAQV
jgi:hypothetical protein